MSVALVVAVVVTVVLAVLLIRELRTAREAVEALETQSREREAERSRLTEQLLAVEQEERRRLALFLHDTSVQSLSAIAMMLDAAVQSIEAGRMDEARTVLGTALERHRATIGALRDLSFNLEPVVLRDQGFEPAVRALAEQLEQERELHVDVEIPAADALGSKAQAALYQIIREALDGAVRRGPPSRISVRIERVDGAIETTIMDDAPGERRRALLDAIAERASTLSGTLDVEQGEQGGTTLRVSLPDYAARV